MARLFFSPWRGNFFEKVGGGRDPIKVAAAQVFTAYIERNVSIYQSSSSMLHTYSDPRDSGERTRRYEAWNKFGQLEGERE